MKDMMRYKNYYGSAHYSDDDKVFYGKVEFIRALVSYEGREVESLCQAFEEAVDDYLQTCREQGKEPEHPFKGSFNIRVGSNLHQRLAFEAIKQGVSLNKYIVEVLERETGKEKTA